MPNASWEKPLVQLDTGLWGRFKIHRDGMLGCHSMVWRNGALEGYTDSLGRQQTYGGIYNQRFPQKKDEIFKDAYEHYLPLFNIMNIFSDSVTAESDLIESNEDWDDGDNRHVYNTREFFRWVHKNYGGTLSASHLAHNTGYTEEDDFSLVRVWTWTPAKWSAAVVRNTNYTKYARGTLGVAKWRSRAVDKYGDFMKNLMADNNLRNLR